MLEKLLENYQVILASKSPRRHHLLKEIGVKFLVQVPEEIEENYPLHLTVEEIPVFLANLKTSPFHGKLKKGDILITADTIVALDGNIIGKPTDREDAKETLKRLSGKKHEVITGVCIMDQEKSITFSSSSRVYFRELEEKEINYYV
ncbi:MAG: Maf family protein, partial [bacterium]